MTAPIDDRIAVAIAHESRIARAITSAATVMSRAWETSALHERAVPVFASVRALSPTERRRCILVILSAALATRLLLAL